MAEPKRVRLTKRQLGTLIRIYGVLTSVADNIEGLDPKLLKQIRTVVYETFNDLCHEYIEKYGEDDLQKEINKLNDQFRKIHGQEIQ